MTQAEKGWAAEQSRVFADHDKTMRGYVRYETTRHNLLKTLSEFLQTPRCIADIGGGQGQDAKWITKVGAGHKVYMYEPDREARREAVKENNGLIEIRPGTTDTALSHFEPGSFDLVLSHGVLMYQANPAGEMAKLSELLKPGGYLSLLNAGMLGKLNRLQARGDIAAVDALRLSGRFRNNLGIEAAAFLPQDIERLIQSCGLETVGWFGVRIFSDDDDRLAEDVGVFHRSLILNREIRASSEPALRPKGQMLHYIVRKP